MCFAVMMALRIVADLFVNIDEFAKLGLPWGELVAYVGSFYGYNALVYFQELSGVMLVAAAAFTLARMNHINELTAMLASGVSLHRVMLPVLLVGMGAAALGVLDQEVLIPRAAGKLARSRDYGAGEGQYEVRLLVDGRGTAWMSRRFSVRTGDMDKPLILLRDDRARLYARVAGRTARYDERGFWDVAGASLAMAGQAGQTSQFILTDRSPDLLEAGKDVRDMPGPTELRIRHQGVDTTRSLLLAPRFDVLTAEAAQAPEPTDAAVTFRAELAWYGPRSPGEREMGYHLVGAAGFQEDDVRNWRGLCIRLRDASTAASEDAVARRLWNRLDGANRRLVLNIAERDPDWKGPGPRSRQRLLTMLNDAVNDPDFLPEGELPEGDLPQPLRMAASVEPAQQHRIVNRFALAGAFGETLARSNGELAVRSDMTPDDIVLRRSRSWLEYMSSSQLGRLLRTGKATDPAEVNLLLHRRFTTPIEMVVMLLLGVPFVLSRERNVKASASLCLATVGAFYIFTFLSHYLGAYSLDPVIAAWLPLLLFGPAAALLLDSVKT